MKEAEWLAGLETFLGGAHFHIAQLAYTYAICTSLYHLVPRVTSAFYRGARSERRFYRRISETFRVSYLI